jgi:hypothetical protein
VKRIKGAINAQIAEETAKQRASASPSRSGAPARRNSTRNQSPSKRPGKPKDPENGGQPLPTGKGPDPSEFDPEFVIGEEEEQPSRSSTPRPKEKAETTDSIAGNGKEKEKEDDGQIAAADRKASPPPEIPPEVQIRLRKLDKLEPKYSGESSSSNLSCLTNTSYRATSLVPHRSCASQRHRSLRGIPPRKYPSCLYRRTGCIRRISWPAERQKRYAYGGTEESFQGAR